MTLDTNDTFNFETKNPKKDLAFPYFLCTFAQIELLTHAYDAHQQYST